MGVLNSLHAAMCGTNSSRIYSQVRRGCMSTVQQNSGIYAVQRRRYCYWIVLYLVDSSWLKLCLANNSVTTTKHIKYINSIHRKRFLSRVLLSFIVTS